MTAKENKRYILAMAIQAEIEGMKAENELRLSNNLSLAYNWKDFFDMSRQLEELANKHEDQL